MNTVYDVIVLGSGASGAVAAQTLIEKGHFVCMIDAGFDDKIYRQAIPDASFSEIRKTDLDQKFYFIGRNKEGIPKGNVKVGAQLTPPRQFIQQNTKELLPYQSSNFNPMQSLATGGLAAGWGAACYTFNREELKRIGIYEKRFDDYYNFVAKRIGISGEIDNDVSPFCAKNLNFLQPPLQIDSNGSSILNSYRRRKKVINNGGLFIGKPLLASLSQNLGDRQANPYFDMDFWSDLRKAIYRPSYTIEGLKKNANFVYLKGYLAIKFIEDSNEELVKLNVIGIDVEDRREVKGKYLILCAGAINSARLAMNSLGIMNHKTSILSSPYTYLPSINYHMLGKKAVDRRHSLAQLMGIFFPKDDPEGNLSLQFYSYRSLLFFKLVKEIPLPVWAGLLITRLIVNCLTIIGVFHPDSPGSLKWLRLIETNDDKLPRVEINYEEEKNIKKAMRKREKSMVKLLHAIGCFPFMRIDPGNGSSIHYAGTIPFSKDPSLQLRVDDSSRLHGTKKVFIGDSSPWRYLPSKGLTFTLMANAARVASNLIKLSNSFKEVRK